MDERFSFAKDAIFESFVYGKQQISKENYTESFFSSGIYKSKRMCYNEAIVT